MRKRFFDREKFNDSWYRKLDLKYKVLWDYLLTECNYAGIFEKFDPEIASFKIGVKITLDDIKFFGARVKILSDSILFIPGFIKFHYGNVNMLNVQNRLHKSVLTDLAKYNLLKFLGASKELLSSLEGTINININIQQKNTSNSFSLFASFSLFLKKNYPKNFTDSCELEKYKALKDYKAENYDLDSLFDIILRENPYKDFAPSLHFILERLPRVKINAPVYKPPPITDNEIVDGICAANEFFSSYGEKYGRKRQCSGG